MNNCGRKTTSENHKFSPRKMWISHASFIINASLKIQVFLKLRLKYHSHIEKCFDLKMSGKFLSNKGGWDHLPLFNKNV